MDLPNGLVEDIRAGRAILFLGAGASLGATGSSGNGPPLGDELRDRLVEKYLPSGFSDRSLAVVTELAISERTLQEVQDFIGGLFSDLEPAPFHMAIPTLRWRALVTTNVDRVIEQAYQDHQDRVQELVVVRSDEDRVDEKLRGSDNVALLKLHGCITVTHREDLPLVLTVDQYATHRDNRGYVFNRFEGWAREYPVVFVGYRLEDINIRDILLRLTRSPATRPRYYRVAPDITEVESRFWESKKVTALAGTLEDFINALEVGIPRKTRSLVKAAASDHPIRSFFRVNEPVPPGVASMLRHDVEYVYGGMPTETGTPRHFYRGFGLGWYPVLNSLDVRRKVTDTLLTDVVIRPDEDRSSPSELYLVRAEAGAGKSVFLRRLAWEAATEADALSLLVRRSSRPNPDDLAELHRVTRQRIFLHWDDAASNVPALRELLTYARQKDLPITVVTAERINEWNMSCEDLSPFLADTFELRRLSEVEVRTLLGLLEQHDCLGPNLAKRSFEERVNEFLKVADRQLLVALHEATTGPPFADILEDEYSNIQPDRARQLYLTVCVLNRLRTPVRAGFISRVHGIPFETFKDELFAPLDHVVDVQLHEASGDYLYRARHPEIAQIVFTRVLSNRDDRLNEYLRIIGNLNLAFDTDREAFRGLLRARSLHDLFPDHRDVLAIFAKAEEVGSREAYFFQQRANYERLRSNGNFDDAEEFIRIARDLDPRDDTVRHTLAEVYRARAEQAAKPLVRQKYRDEARSTLRALLASRGDDEYSRVTLIKIELDGLKDLLADEHATDREIDETIRRTDRLISEALQHHPEEQYVLTAEADFSTIVADDDRSLLALKRASEANPRDPYIANRLARALLRQGDPDAAREKLRIALEGNRGDMRLNFQYGEILRLSGEQDPAVLAHYFERSFTPRDRNYEAQFWFARYAFECRDERLINKSHETFRSLRHANMSFHRRVRIRDHVKRGEKSTVFQGTMERVEQTYARIRRDGPADLIFVHANQVGEEAWVSLKPGTRVCFAIGFSFGGPAATGLEILGL